MSWLRAWKTGKVHLGIDELAVILHLENEGFNQWDQIDLILEDIAEYWYGYSREQWEEWIIHSKTRDQIRQIIGVSKKITKKKL